MRFAHVVSDVGARARRRQLTAVASCTVAVSRGRLHLPHLHDAVFAARGDERGIARVHRDREDRADVRALHRRGRDVQRGQLAPSQSPVDAAGDERGRRDVRDRGDGTVVRARGVDARDGAVDDAPLLDHARVVAGDEVAVAHGRERRDPGGRLRGRRLRRRR